MSFWHLRPVILSFPTYKAGRGVPESRVLVIEHQYGPRERSLHTGAARSGGAEGGLLTPTRVCSDMSEGLYETRAMVLATSVACSPHGCLSPSFLDHPPMLTPRSPLGHSLALSSCGVFWWEPQSFCQASSSDCVPPRTELLLPVRLR